MDFIDQDLPFVSTDIQGYRKLRRRRCRLAGCEGVEVSPAAVRKRSSDVVLYAQTWINRPLYVNYIHNMIKTMTQV